MKSNKRILPIFIGLVISMMILFYLNLRIGSVSIETSDLFKVFKGNTEDVVNYRILMDIRLPRAIAALLLGGALSVSGFLLQTFFHNPIAGPFILGISSGAKLVVSIVMILALGQGIVLNSFGLIIAAFVGAMMSMMLVLLVSKKVHRMSVLIICGVMIGYICSAITDFCITFADDSNIINLHSWSLGSFAGTSWEHVRIMSVAVFITVFVTFFLSKPMNAYQMGESYAKNVGVNIGLLRILLILLSSILSATVTAFAGPISFVGVAVPHLIKSLTKSAKPIILIPGCFFGGAVFCLFCDLIARTLFAPTELSISSVTAVFGAPIVIYMMIKRAKQM